MAETSAELAALAGDVLVVGIPGREIGPDVSRTLHDLRPGGYVLFARNIASVVDGRGLVRSLREAADALICVDQEGGRVARIPAEPPMPTMMALGASNDTQLAYDAGRTLGDTVRSIDATVNFAPVLDVVSVEGGTIIGTRALGTDAEVVARLGVALLRGIEDAGVVAVAKHFPGHGGTAIDSHIALPRVDATLATLRLRDLVPFRAAIEAGARAIMVGHVLYPHLDVDHPASLSARILGDLLRGELGFAGAVMTDCVQMGAIASGIGSVVGSVRALIAGVDAITVSDDLALALEIRDAIVAAVMNKTLREDRLREAAGRLRSLRRTAASLRSQGTADPSVAREIARRAITIVRGDVRLEPASPVTVISFEGTETDGVARLPNPSAASLSLALRRRRLRSESLRAPLDPDDAMIAALGELLQTQGSRNVVVIARRLRFHPGQRHAIDAILRIVPAAIVVAALEPLDWPLLARAHRLVATFGDGETEFEACADVLAGR